MGLLLAAWMLLAVSFPLLWAQKEGDRPLPDEKKFLEEAFAKVRAWEKAPPMPSFREERLTTDYDGNDRPKERKREVYRIDWYRNHPVYVLERQEERLVPQESQKKDEASKKREIDREISTPSGKEKIEAIAISPLLERYRFRLMGREVVRGRPALKFRFDPIPGRFPEGKISWKILARTGGYAWVDEEERELTRVEAENLDSIHIGWGILGNISLLKVEYERDRLPSGLWFVSSLRIRAKVRVLFVKTYNRLSESHFVDIRERSGSPRVP